MTKDMFPHLTEAIVKKLGANSDLISNDALNKKWEMLTLVKIGTKSFFSYFFPRPKYTCYDLKLSDIVDENICLDYNKEILVKDFKNFSLDSVSVEAGGDVVGAQGSVSGNNEESSSPATLMSEGISQRDLAKLIMRPNKIKVKERTELITLKKGEKLAFVKQRVYNTCPVEFKSKTSTSWSVVAKISKFIPGCSESVTNEVTSFTIPENNQTFAFALKEITIEDGFLEIRPEYTSQVLCFRFSENIKESEEHPQMEHLKMFPCIFDVIKDKGKVLEPLAGLSESTRRELLRKLADILEDLEALAQLEDTLDRVGYGEHERPQSEAVASFMDLLDVSKVSRDQTEALHLLVGALQALPDSAAALLAKTGPETLTCISSMIKALKDGQARLPEAPPLPLQEKGELRWVAQFIISANDLEALKKTWAYPHFSPEGLLELLYVSVEGLGRMQSTGKS
ncbi:uncharacterized protein FYW61_015117 [Anableps anableps]